MYPKLYNSSGELQAVLDNIIKETAAIRRVVNGEFTFSFEAYEKALKSEYFDKDNSIVTENQTFDVKYIEQLHETEVKYTIQCEHVNYRMKDGAGNLYASYAYVGTPTAILTDILAGTEFSVGTVDFATPITLSIAEEITRKDLIKYLANYLGGEIEYTDLGFTINILNTIGQDNGFEARFGKNLKGITKIIDDRGVLTTYYEIDLVELKNSNEYQEKQLQDLEVIGIGDTIRIIDEVISLDVQNRIVSIEYNPIFAVNTSLEIANEIELITDKVTEIETNAVQRDRLYNNVAISVDYGFRATRSDKRARTTLGGDSISMDVGDGLGNYTPAMYFDVLSGKYKFVGDIEASGTITGADFIGGTINIGSGTFTVDALGNVIANSITIGGGSGISNFTDAGDLATLDQVDTVHITNDAITAPKINVTSLSAITADLGTVTAGTISGVNIYGGRYYNSFGDTYMDMGLTQEIRIADTSDDAGLIMDVQSGVDLFHVDASNDAYEFLSSNSGYTNATNIWNFTSRPLYGGSFLINGITAGHGIDVSNSNGNVTVNVDETELDDDYLVRQSQGAGVTSSYLQFFTDRVEAVVNGTAHVIASW